MALTQAQVYTLRRMRSGTRYIMRGDGRYGTEVRFCVSSRCRDDIRCASLAPLLRNGYIAFKQSPAEITKYYDLTLTARGLEAACEDTTASKEP